MRLAGIHRIAVESMKQPLLVRDGDLNILYANPAFTELTGLTAQEALGKKCYEILGYDERTCKEKCSIDNLASEGPRLTSYDRSEITGPCFCGGKGAGVSPIYEGNRVCGSVIVLSETDPPPTAGEKQERATTPAPVPRPCLNLKRPCLEIDRTLEEALAGSSFGICYFKGGKLRWTNRAMMGLFGYGEEPEKDFLDKNADEFFSSHEEYERIMSELSAKISQGGSANAEARLKRKDGSVFLGEVSVSPGDGTQADEGMTVLVSNITGRKSAKEESSRLGAAIEQAVESILITDAEGTIQYANSAFYELTGYAPDEVVGRNPRILKSGEHDQRFYAELWKTISSGQVWKGRLINKKKNGEMFEEETVISPVKDESGHIINYVAVKHDVTSRLLLEKQLQQTQKMAALGNLAGGIAHDFNNLLQIVLAYSEMLIMTADENLTDKGCLETIQKAAKDAGQLAKRLITFNRKVESKPRPCDLNAELRNLKSMLRRTIPRMIEIELDLAEDLRLVEADPIQMEQVLLNLCINSQQAMPNGGALTIRTANVTGAHLLQGSLPGGAAKQHVMLTVSDTGEGIGEHALPRIFEPFFTTKKSGEGSGLGLAIAQGIVKCHGGNIECESKLGHGTTFLIYLPALGRKALTADARTTRDMPAVGSETILLVDDEERINAMAAHLLTKNGYTVYTAEDGVQALEVFRTHRGGIDLVILDVVMPEMGGAQCLEEILKIDPHMKILISSGYRTDEFNDEALERAKGFVDKPYASMELLRKVREVLDIPLDSGPPLGPKTSGMPDEAPPNALGRFPSHGAKPAAKSRDAFPKMRILAVDDRMAYLKVLEAGLQQFGQTTFAASSGAEAIQLFKGTTVDLVICDLGLPDLSGWEVGKDIQRMCREEGMPKTPFVLLTGSAGHGESNEETDRRVVECGVDAVLGKPVDIPELLEVAARLVRGPA